VQFHRKRTFDAGATPGLDDFERPELKSISDDLVADLREISDEQERRESELADLRQEVERKAQRIRELEAELEEARDLSRMADKFAQAMLRKAEAPYRGGDGRNAARPLPSDQAELREYEPEEGDADANSGSGTTEPNDSPGDSDAEANADATGEFPTIEPNEWPTPGPVSAEEGNEADGGAEASTEEQADGDTDGGTDASTEEQADVTFDAGEAPAVDERAPAEASTVDSTESGATPGTREAVVARLRDRIEALPDLSQAMLAHYREAGTADPVDAHVAAGGTPKQTLAYGRNRPLRRAGFVEHVERDTYRYALSDRVAERFDGHLDEVDLASVQRDVERAFVDEAALVDESVDDDEGRSIPAEERPDVEMVPDEESVEPDDGFVTEDVAIIDDDSADGGDNDDGGTTTDAEGDDGTATDAEDDDGTATDAEDDGGTAPAERDTGGVEIL
jgi:hypothetical protein